MTAVHSNRKTSRQGITDWGVTAVHSNRKTSRQGITDWGVTAVHSNRKTSRQAITGVLLTGVGFFCLQQQENQQTGYYRGIADWGRIFLSTATGKPTETGERGASTAGGRHQQTLQASPASATPGLPPGGQPDRPALQLHLRVLLSEHCQAPNGRSPSRKCWCQCCWQQQLVVRSHDMLPSLVNHKELSALKGQKEIGNILNHGCWWVSCDEYRFVSCNLSGRHSLCCLHNIYLCKTFLLQLIALEKSLYSTHRPLTNTVQEPLLHLPTQYKSLCSIHHHKSLCSTPRSLNTTRAFAPLTVHSTQYNSLCSIHLTTQYKSLYSTQQHITGRFAPLTICTATQYWGLCSTHHLFNNTVQGTGTVQGPLLHSPTQYKSLYSTTHYRSLCFTHHSCNNTLQEPLLHSPFTQQHGTGAFVPLTNTV